MRANRKDRHRTKVVPAVIVLGLDPGGKPRGAWFPADQAELAAKAADQMQYRTLKPKDVGADDLVAQLPAGRIHANGRSAVPIIRAELFAKLLEAAGLTLPEVAGIEVPVAQGFPRSWDEVAVGHLVIAQESRWDGWWEAIVIAREGDMLTLRWRDYPRQALITQHLSTVALLPASAS